MITESIIQKCEEFLHKTFNDNRQIWGKEADMNYRIEHSYRVAHLAKEIGEKEGLDADSLFIGGLLHDIAYCEKWEDNENGWMNHGRRSAEIARPFLEELGLAEALIQDICYGIAIHVDDKSDFEGKRNSFTLTIAAADNIDRFDVYRIYEVLDYVKFRDMSLNDKLEWLENHLSKLKKWKEYIQKEPSNETADRLLQERLNYQELFFSKLKKQIESSK